MASAVDDPFGFVGSMFSFNMGGQWADWLLYGAFAAFIIWWIIDSRKFNKKIILQDETGSVPVTRILRAKDSTDKVLGKPTWFITKIKKHADVPPASSIGVQSNGKLIAKCKLTATGDIIWLDWDNDYGSKVTGLSAHDKEVLANNYARSKEFTKENNLMGILDKHGGGIIVLIILLMIFFFYEDILSPARQWVSEVTAARVELAKYQAQDTAEHNQIMENIRQIRGEGTAQNINTPRAETPPN